MVKVTCEHSGIEFESKEITNEMRKELMRTSKDWGVYVRADGSIEQLKFRSDSNGI
jgi:hypothetical protein